ncbi:MAG: substrate-binding domain-containing protein [Stigonema ocellatum SAG 48.90 = DSM 106950]|nr:substrate-binding domain-containing protein [Stigonema ocellatum SAG 48.90 = DSM 106950]
MLFNLNHWAKYKIAQVGDEIKITSIVRSCALALKRNYEPKNHEFIKHCTKTASVAVITLSVAFVQKASAQVYQPKTPPTTSILTGAGSSTITSLLDSNFNGFTGTGLRDILGSPDSVRYTVTGSGAGRTALANGRVDFVSSDSTGLAAPPAVVTNSQGSVVPTVAVSPLDSGIAFPYNVPTDPTNPNSPQFDLTIDGETGCKILRGDLTNWNQVVNQNSEVGPDLPIRRVARGDSSGTTDTLQSGVVSLCNTVSSLFIGDIRTGTDSLTGETIRRYNFSDGTRIPQRNVNDIIVTPASLTANSQPDVITAGPLFNISTDPFHTGDDNNVTPVSPLNLFGSYSPGVINTVMSTPGAIGYADSGIAIAARVPLATYLDPSSGVPTKFVTIGPNYFLFRRSGNGAKTGALRKLCRAVSNGSAFQAYAFSIVDSQGNQGYQNPSAPTQGKCKDIMP